MGRFFRLPAVCVAGFVVVATAIAPTAQAETFKSLSAASAKAQDLTPIRRFLRRGADVNESNAFGATPLYHTLLNSQGAEIAALLLEAGADVDARITVSQVTTLHQAVQLNLPLARVLIEGGADIEARDIWGRTPLFYAVGISKQDGVQVLLDAGADLTVKDKTGKRILDFAKTPEFVAYLKGLGAR